MQLSSAILTSWLISSAIAAPASIESRAPQACFIVGNSVLPQEVIDSVNQVQPDVTCDTSRKTIANVPDVISGALRFSSINFSQSKESLLSFALATFKTAAAGSLAKTDLATLQDQLNVYIATQAGVRSGTTSPAAIKIPTFFLQFQKARVQTAQGIKITNPSDTVEHQLGKVLKNAAGDSQAVLDQVMALSKVLT